MEFNSRRVFDQVLNESPWSSGLMHWNTKPYDRVRVPVCVFLCCHFLKLFSLLPFIYSYLVKCIAFGVQPQPYQTENVGYRAITEAKRP